MKGAGFYEWSEDSSDGDVSFCFSNLPMMSHAKLACAGLTQTPRAACSYAGTVDAQANVGTERPLTQHLRTHK